MSPHILTPFIESSIAEVAAMRRSIASSHSAWRFITRLVAIKDARKATAVDISIDSTFVRCCLTYCDANRYCASNAQLALEKIHGQADLECVRPYLPQGVAVSFDMF